MHRKEVYLEDDPLWYKDAVIYELHVKAFHDSANDGIGDFKGLLQKLDYLESLGITAIWLLPFYPSPLKDDGYDISDYFNVHPDYGTLRDFQEFLREAHARGIRVITELVLNHTSDQHAWFQRARQAKPGSVWRNFYVWSDTPDKYQDARIIFKDFERSNWSWDPVAKAYYWHRFYSHQPDLNFDNPQVRKAMMRAMDFWLSMGVDGLRLDAVPYLFEREGTNCENLPETYEFLKMLRSYIDSKHKNKMLLAEANQWPEDATAYFGDGDEAHMAFHFPLMPRMFMAVRMEDRFPIVDILEQTPPIPESCQWALFLRNHDELTLEMVTDEERDYMYRIYAKDPKARINLGIRRRLAPLLGNHRRKMEIMNFLLLSLPGTPIIYYGDEIGMGDNYYLGDRDGVRTPMQWSADRNGGFSRANPQKLYLPVNIDPEYHFEAINVETQERNLASPLWWMKRVIGMRKRVKAFGRGSIEFLFPDNPRVLAFIRKYRDENILVVINLSRFPQVVELDLSKYAGCVPEEVVGRNNFPLIKETPYVLTLGFYDYFWFLLRREEEVIGPGRRQCIPEMNVRGSWEKVLEGKSKEKLEQEILPSFIIGCRWFGSKARKIQWIRITESIRLERDESVITLLLLEIRYTEGLSDVYLLPLSFASEDEAELIVEENSQAVIARLKTTEAEGIIFDAVYSRKFRRALFWMLTKKSTFKGLNGKITTYPGKLMKTLKFSGREFLSEKSQVLKAEQSNTSLLYGTELILKLYRHLEEGINPELEMSRFLTEKASFPNIPAYAGTLEYSKQDSEPTAIGILQGFVPNQGDAWTFTVDSVARYFERVLSQNRVILDIPADASSILTIAYREIPPLLQELLAGVYLEMANLLGRRTAELHKALSSKPDDPDFAPEPFSLLYQRAICHGLQVTLKRVFQLLRKSLASLSEEVQAEAEEVLTFEKKIISQSRAILQKKLSAMKIRIHGDYHLGQVLYTGKDFVIIDFEGEPARSLSERRLKRSPVRDVAGMIRSFQYAAYTALLQHASIRVEDVPFLEPWADLWYRYIGGAFLRSYIDTAENEPFIPKDKEEFSIMLKTFLLEKAIYELGYELNNRPGWVAIPLRGIKHLLESS